MKFIKIIFTVVLIFGVFYIPRSYASSIDPGVIRETLVPGETKSLSLKYTNSENRDVKVLITPYSYNPKTDAISEEKKLIFIKADTDTISVKANSTFNIRYQIYPISNISEGTYYNILAITPVTENANVGVNTSISQLIILDIVNTENEIKGVTTSQYSTTLKVIKKGIPFITPTVIRYSIKNNSNYLLIPTGRLDIFNEKNSYKPRFIYINQDNQKVYPGETLEKEAQVKGWHITDLFLKRVVMGEVFNGVDNTPQYVGSEISPYLFEISILSIAVILAIFFIKSVKQDLKKKP